MEPNSSIFTEAEADDYLAFDISNDPPVNQSFGAGNDLIEVSGDGLSQVRLAFTSSEVGNGSDVDSGNLANQNGSLAVRLRAEDDSTQVTGDTSKFDDEGINFIANGDFTFDVRDIPTGISRGDQFSVVRLGTMAADLYNEGASALRTYINAGMGDDSVTGGDNDDFLVGGAGNDILDGGAGDDSFIGGGGNDTIFGRGGADSAIFNVSTDGSDTVNLGGGNDSAFISAGAGVTQVRLTFTSAEVGNGDVNDRDIFANQDGDLAVRLQAQSDPNTLTGAISRFDDEAINFVAATGVSFDVRDLPSGVGRGLFQVVALGGTSGDGYYLQDETRDYYINAGTGDDTIVAGSGNNTLVGGGGNDSLTGGTGDDSFIGGAGRDGISGGDGDDRVTYNASMDGTDNVNLGNGDDVVFVGATPGTSEIRLTFTSAEVGNGSASDSGTLTNQDGLLAVRMQVEGVDEELAEAARFDDEGTTFVSNVEGTFFDVRDLPSGVSRGDRFEVVVLGTSGDDAFDESDSDRSYYVNAGGGNDTVTGSTVSDFLVGGAGNDILDGGADDDSLLGGGGADIFVFSAENPTIIDDLLGTGGPGDDTIVDFVSGTDKIDLSAFELSADDVTSSTVAGNIVLSIDTTGDDMGDFTITLNGVTTAPVTTDYIL